MRALPVVAPCHEPFEAMTGDDRTRHCDKCDRKVHDLSARTEDEARDLLASASGRVCVRYARDRGGNVRFRAAATLAVALSASACSAVDTQSAQIGPIAPVPVADAAFDPNMYTVGEYLVDDEPATHAHCNAGNPPNR